METVASADEVTIDRLVRASTTEVDFRRLAVDAFETDVINLEEHLASRGNAGADHVLHRFLLPVDRDRASGQFVHVDAMASMTEAQFDAVMDQTLAAHPLAESSLIEQIDGALFEDPGPHALLAMPPASGLKDNRVNPFQMKEVGEQKPGWSRTDDTDLSAHVESTLDGKRTEWILQYQFCPLLNRS